MNPQQTEEKDALLYQPSKVSWATAEFVRRPPSYAARSFIYLMSFLFAGSLVYAYFAKVPITINTKGALQTEQAPLPILAPATAKVVELRVKENETVRQGTVLVVTDNYIGDKDYRSLGNITSSLLEVVKRDKAGQCTSTCQGELQRLSAGSAVIHLKGSLQDNLLQIQDLLKEYLNARTNLANVDQLTVEQRRQIQVSEEKIRTIKRRKAIRLLGTEIEQLNTKIGSLRSEIADRQNNLRVLAQQSQDRLEVRLNSFMGTVDEFRLSQTVSAPVDGIITRLNVSGGGQMITAGQLLLEIIPTRSKLDAELSVENKDIAKVLLDQEVKLKLDAFPEREYGAVEGIVSEIPVSASTQTAARDTAPASYKVIVKMAAQSVTKNGKTYPFRVGMTLTGLIITKRETLLELGIKEIFKVKDAFIQD